MRAKLSDWSVTLKVESNNNPMYDFWVSSSDPGRSNSELEQAPAVYFWGPREAFTFDNRKECALNSRDDTWILGFECKPEGSNYVDDSEMPTATITETCKDQDLHDRVLSASKGEFPVEALLDCILEHYPEYAAFFAIYSQWEVVDVPPSKRKRKRKGRTA